MGKKRRKMPTSLRLACSEYYDTHNHCRGICHYNNMSECPYINKTEKEEPVEEENEEEKEEQICWCCQTVITGTVEEIEIHGDTETVCQDCFRSKFERCDWCDDLILSSDFHDVQTST